MPSGQTDAARTSLLPPELILTGHDFKGFRRVALKSQQVTDNIIWPVLDTGRNSVNPSTTPNLPLSAASAYRSSINP